jgi:hypothetical protein
LIHRTLKKEFVLRFAQLAIFGAQFGFDKVGARTAAAGEGERRGQS